MIWTHLLSVILLTQQKQAQSRNIVWRKGTKSIDWSFGILHWKNLKWVYCHIREATNCLRPTKWETVSCKWKYKRDRLGSFLTHHVWSANFLVCLYTRRRWWIRCTREIKISFRPKNIRASLYPFEQLTALSGLQVSRKCGRCSPIEILQTSITSSINTRLTP